MAYGVMINSKISQLGLDRSCVSESDYENGSVGNLLTKSTTAGEAEVWVMTAPVTGALSNLWMVYEPEIVDTISGTSTYRGIDPDPRNFINKAGKVFSAFPLVLGDLVKLSVDAVAGTISTNTFVVATNAAQKLTWAAAAVSGVSLKLVGTEYISIGTGSLGSQRITAYLFNVVAVA